jgi:hypothetical protein
MNGKIGGVFLKFSYSCFGLQTHFVGSELDALWCTRQAWQDFGNVLLFCVCAWSVTMVLDGIMASNYGRNFLS